MNRAERIKLATRKIEQLKPKFEKAKNEFSIVEKEFKTAEFELAKETASFDIGEKVDVVSFCGRGCCVENRFSGIVDSKTDNGCYNIKSDGSIYKYISGGDMTRVG